MTSLLGAFREVAPSRCSTPPQGRGVDKPSSKSSCALTREAGSLPCASVSSPERDKEASVAQHRGRG